MKLQDVSPDIAKFIKAEDEAQKRWLRMIPSENYASPAVLEALGSSFSNRYGEGYPGKRYYQGQQHTDELESAVIAKACALFKYPHANVQALSGAPANLGVYAAFLPPNKGGRVMAMRLDHGGHLTHGSTVSVTGQWWEFKHYGVNGDDVLDMAEVRAMALEFKPQVLVCGYTAYPRTIDFAAFGAIAKEVGAISLADVSHIAGLVAGGAHPSPWPHIDIVTFTTHKTLRGPRAAVILCKDQAQFDKVNFSVFPGLQGGPHFNTIAAMGVALDEAATPGFRTYSSQVVANAKRLARALTDRSLHVVSGGTDNHLLLVDTRKSRDLPGKRVAQALEDVSIILNFNTVPNASDKQKPLAPDGIRMGTPSLTTRGMKEEHMDKVAEFIDRCVKNIKTGKLGKEESPYVNDAAVAELRAEVEAFASKFPTFVYHK